MLAINDWAEEKDRSRVFYRAATPGDTDDSLVEAFNDLRRKLATDVLPKHASADWDCLRAEFWPDSGRLIVYPGRANSAARTEKSGCDLVIRSLLGFWEALVDSDTGDDVFVRRVRAELRRYAELLLQTWNRQASKIEGAPQEIRILFFEAEEQTPFVEATLPASALSLTSGVLKNSS
jgi:hypothetical protein